MNSIIKYLTRVWWDNIVHNILTIALSLMFGFAVFALSMAMVEMKEERVELVRYGRKKGGEGDLEEIEVKNLKLAY